MTVFKARAFIESVVVDRWPVKGPFTHSTSDRPLTRGAYIHLAIDWRGYNDEVVLACCNIVHFAEEVCEVADNWTLMRVVKLDTGHEAADDVPCSCSRRMMAMGSSIYQQLNGPSRDDFALYALNELPDELTAPLVHVTCTLCGAQFYTGKLSQLEVKLANES